ncbi:MAG: archease [Thermoplasmata archaeon]|nr:MAG: archease [Thermoplasmata archaeon]
MKFEVFETTADVGIIAYGDTLDELFENSALGMFSLMCNINKVEPREKKSIKAEGDSLESLLVEWLTQLLALRDIYGMMFSKFKARVDKENIKVYGEAFGEETREEHEIEVEVKAVTYHMLEVSKNKVWKAKFILDI